jgi:UDP-N-acetylglucosamine 2-epimerase
MNVTLARRIILDIEEEKIKFKNFENPYGKPGLSKKIVEFLK